MMSNNKRSRAEMEESMAATMEKCLMILSSGQVEIDYHQSVIKQQTRTSSSSSQDRVYECKTCNKQFSSFQALGGHRASHKKPRLMELYSSDNQSVSENKQQEKKPKMHECSICGLKFGIGQALGGHMRKHRAAMTESSPPNTTTTGLSSSSSSDNSYNDLTREEEVLPEVPVFKRSNSSRRVLSLNLDLSLSLLPFESGDNDFEFSSLVKPDQYVVPTTPSMIYSFI